MPENHYLIKESTLTNIADAIREKNSNIKKPINALEMSDAIRDIQVGGFSTCGYLGTHVDENGVWHIPEDWENIENIDLTGVDNTMYFLCQCHRGGTAFLRLRIYGTGNMYWSYGHVHGNEYIPSSGNTKISNGGYVALYLEKFEEDYLVIKIWSETQLQQCNLQAWAANSDYTPALTAQNNAILMRYGRMSYGVNITCSCYTLESDNVIDFATKTPSTTALTMTSAYASCYALQRWRCTGWNIPRNKVVTFASFFSNCYGLSDFGNSILDLSGWVQINTTAINSWFNNCYSMNLDEIKVNDWIMTNVTTCSNFLYNARNLKRITGIETWSEMTSCTTTANMLYYCWNLDGELDFSNCRLPNLTTAVSMFQECEHVKKINLKNITFSKCTTIANLCNGCRSLREVLFDDNLQLSQCTTSASFIANTAIQEIIIDGWNFSGSSAAAVPGSFATYCYGLQKAIIRNCIWPSSMDDASNGSWFRYCYALTYLDVSDFDLRTATGTAIATTGFRDLIALVDFYPPKHINKSFNLSSDYQLSHDSLMRVINNLDTVTTKQTLTIGAVNKSKLTAEEQAIATSKNWAIA